MEWLYCVWQLYAHFDAASFLNEIPSRNSVAVYSFVFVAFPIFYCQGPTTVADILAAKTADVFCNIFDVSTAISSNFRENGKRSIAFVILIVAVRMLTQTFAEFSVSSSTCAGTRRDTIQ